MLLKNKYVVVDDCRLGSNLVCWDLCLVFYYKIDHCYCRQSNAISRWWSMFGCMIDKGRVEWV